MFEKFVLRKIDAENSIINNFWESILSGDKLLKEAVVSSNLSDFTKAYIINDLYEEVDKDELQSRIEKANKLYFNYTIRPKWTLVTFLFNNFESRPPAEIIKKLKTFPFYNYYAEGINDFIKQNSQIFVTKGEISGVIDRTNKALHEKLTIDINNVKIRNFFLQVFKLKYEEDKYNLESKIPYSFIKIFLDDKSYPDLEKKFRAVKEINEEYEISLMDITKVLTDKYNVTGEAITKEKEPPLEKKAEPEKSVTPVLVSKENTKKEPGKITVKKIEPKTEVKKIPEQEKIYSEQLLQASKEEPESGKDKPVQSGSYDVKDLFNEKQLEKITDKVYNSDLINREKSFTKLNHYKTWFEASNHLKEIIKTKDVDIYNKEVISYINILNDFFQNRE
ncbi:MAG: hypothetical protein ABI462_15030 [Ignavibacteria bacterium]